MLTCHSQRRRSRGSASLQFFLWLVVSATFFLVDGSLTFAQFDSGSTGVDGALDFTGTPGGTIIDFDPSTFTPPLDGDLDSVYHFTTITIPPDVTIRFRQNSAGSLPIHWLASGPVVIDGTLDLSGEDGHAATNAPKLFSALGKCWYL